MSSDEQSTEESTTAPAEGGVRADRRALYIGIAASFVFTALVALLDHRLAGVELLPDQGASWYEWKLPAPTWVTRGSVWGLYLAHQFFCWIVMWRAQAQRPGWVAGLHHHNIVLLVGNAVFIGLHFVQTHIWYDGLAQDVSVWSSMGSVVVLLIWVLLMEQGRRGLFFGKSLPFGQRMLTFARRSHGTYFSWAIIYTFWFHPMVSTVGHLWGFFYMFLLMLQSSLFFTRVHRNRRWTLLLELVVLVHGTMVAWMQGQGLWPMFFFGFGGIFVITQMYGLGWSRLARLGVLVAYMAAALAVYIPRGLGAVNEIIRIPVIDYLGVLILAGLLGVGVRIWDAVRPGKRVTTSDPSAGSSGSGA